MPAEALFRSDDLQDAPLSDRASPGRTYQVVVIGSGYGGAIVAARLAEKQLGVAIFERGREWAPDALPSTLADAAAQVKRPANPLGLFDLRQGEDLDVLSGSGLGGTSLINGNVAVRAPVEVFDDPRWPASLRGAAGRAELDPYYARAEAALGAQQTPDALALSKVRARSAYAVRVGLELRIPKLTIHFGETGADAPPSTRRPCVMCGDCIVGCRVGAKNTLAQNYLLLAKQRGAAIVTQTEVRFVLPHPDGGWEIHARAHPAEGGPPTDHVVRASAVVIGAGALGSTAILLRSRLRGLRLGARVGHHFGGNADRAGYGYNNDTFIGAIGRRDTARHPQPVGPTIASMTMHTDQRGRQFLIQEGAVPSPLVLPTRVLLAAAAATRGEDTDTGTADAAREAMRIARDAFALGDQGALAHTMLMLAMGDDDADGRVILDAREAPRVVWGALADKPIFRAMDAEMRAQVAALGGTWVPNPNPWRGFGGPPMTVHPLGGVPMGDDPEAGVVDHLGRVFHPDGGVLPGLYVVDGSIVPSSLRVNPMLTIAALAAGGTRGLELHRDDDRLVRSPDDGSRQHAGVPRA
jgi:cholesterol oxidase